MRNKWQNGGVGKKKKDSLVIAGEIFVQGEEQTNTQNALSRVLVWFFVTASASLVFAGVLLDFARIWQAEYRREFALIILGISAGISLVVCLEEKIRFLSAVVSLFLFAVGAYTYARLFEGAKECANLIIASWNLYFDTHYGAYHIAQSELSYFLLYVLAWLILLYVRSVLKAGSRAGIILPCVSIVCMGLLVGKGPDGEAFFLMLAGTLPAFAFAGRSGGRICPGRLLLKNGLLVVAVFAAGTLAYGRLEEELSVRVKENHDSLLAYQRNLEQQVIDFVDDFEGGFSVFSGNSSNGRITNRSPHYTDKEMFWVTMEEKPEAKLYFRGFVGDTYEDGKWSPVEEEEFFSMTEGTALSHEEQGKAILNQSFEFGDMWLGMPNEFVEMLYSDNCGEYAYLPYFSSLYGIELQDLMIDADAVIRRPKDTVHLAFRMIQMSAGVLGGAGYQYAVQIPNREEFISQYSGHARIHYTQVPAQGIERILSLADTWKREGYGVEPYDFNYAIPISKVVTELEAGTTYSLNPGRVPFGTDVVENFLFDSKEGFCIHYASAATLLLRRLGVPARYVSGYAVDPAEFEKNPDGSYTASVVDRNGHAWVEVFMDRAGWIPIEATAGVYSMNYGMDEDSIRNAEMMREILGEEDETETQRDIPKETENRQETEKASEAQKTLFDSQRADRDIRWIFLIAAVCIPASVLLNKRRRELVRKRKLRKADTRSAVLEISHDIYKLLRRADVIKEKNMTDEAYIKQAQKWAEQQGEDGFAAFMECVRRTAFSEYMPSKEEVIEGRRIYRKLVEKQRRGNKEKSENNLNI